MTIRRKRKASKQRVADYELGEDAKNPFQGVRLPLSQRVGGVHVSKRAYNRKKEKRELQERAADA